MTPLHATALWGFTRKARMNGGNGFHRGPDWGGTSAKPEVLVEAQTWYFARQAACLLLTAIDGRAVGPDEVECVVNPTRRESL